MLVFVTILGFFLGDNSQLQQDVVHSVFSHFPVIGDSIRLGSLKGSGLALAIGVFLAAMKLLTVADVSWKELLPGAVLAALAAIALQSLGGYIVNHISKNADRTYGTLGVVITLLSWIYLQAQVFLFSAEVNTVRKFHAWPRALDVNNPTDADLRMLEGLAEAEVRLADESIDVQFRRVS
jgi:membrane protein